MATAKTISLQELLTGNYTFIIKSYQRGYRWEKREIKALIRDLSSIKSCQEYCIQPIIVKPTGTDHEYELVDGQQRLTTLWLMKEFYASKYDKFDDPNAKNNYSIVYENKFPLQAIMDKLQKFLSENENSLNKIAGFNEKQMYEQLAADLTCDAKGQKRSFQPNEHPDIDSFIENVMFIAGYKDNASDGSIKSEQSIVYFLNKIFQLNNEFRRASNIKLIWYELNPKVPSEDPITVFTNVNANKVKLTNAELVKSRLMYELKKDGEVAVKEDPRRTVSREKLALEWESIERGLNNDSFWYFIYGKKGKYETRIDFLFEIYLDSSENTGEEFWIYDAIDKRMEFRAKKPVEIWEDIRQIYYKLSDWYEDDMNNIYHLLGLIVAIKNDAKEHKARTIKKYYDLRLTKSEFATMLKEDIREAIYKDAPGRFKKDEVEDWIKTLDYDVDGKLIKNILFAYNIATLVNSKNSYERFPFDLYNGGDYDIEHINPKSKYKNEEDEETKIKNIKRIGNLVLLDANTNRSGDYSDESYGTKRQKIIDILRNGDDGDPKIKYIPIATRWVFLEAFDNQGETSNKPIQPDDVWNKHDIYVSDIADNLVKMLGEYEYFETEEGSDNE